MPAAACKIWLSSHIWATLLKSWTVVECMLVCALQHQELQELR
jgi:hypothetical protein